MAPILILSVSGLRPGEMYFSLFKFSLVREEDLPSMAEFDLVMFLGPCEDAQLEGFCIILRFNFSS